MPLFLWDWTLILLVPAIVLSLYAQYKVKTTFNKYSKVPSAQGLTGAQAARRLLDSAGLQDVQIEAASGRLSDHYDPVSYTHLRAHETDSYLVCRLLLEKKKKKEN